MNWDIIRTPRFWAVVLPPLLALWAGSSLFKMLDARKEIQQTAGYLADVEHTSKLLLSARQEGMGGRNGTVKTVFTPVTSALESARKAGIPEARVSRGESSLSSQSKDGKTQNRENYNLAGVRLMQLVTFIDHIENDYADVNCTQINLTPIPGGLDNWDVSIELRYLGQ
ncbi:MAG: hypothetical protein JW709_02925 [Sedimentisphaerales bacterium]|nr:hypothetical protein [Sedimentisphaerales bacterium]